MTAVRHMKTMATLLALVLTLGVPATTWAGDDGGGRSVFGYGAGNRALGLGGAYGAIANDASAVLWNPGGLGLVTRPGMEVTQTSYYGLEMSEQYASLVFPHWRLGSASITFRRFGVSGIEERDERNALLSDDLSDSETELLLGYGRRLGRAWSIGGAVKLRRHALAGFNDSGVGLDLGVVLHPFAIFRPGGTMDERLAVGLSVRNAVQPELRLLQEQVTDPTGVRLGAAYLLPVFGRQTLLAAVDIEKTIDMDARIHSGLEYAVHPLLTLRMGVSDGSLTAGTGIGWHGVAVDYTFEQNEIENVHRVGATVSFGRTVEQSRLAALEARENELRARLDASFAQRQSARVTELLEDADAASAAGRCQDALYTLSVAAALDPGNEAAARRRVDCLVELGKQAEYARDHAAAMLSYSEALAIDPGHEGARWGYDRSRAESDRLAARTEERRRQFAAAMDAFMDQRFVEARSGFSTILASTAEDEEAAEMLARTEHAIDRMAKDLVEQADRFLGWGQLNEAERAIDQAEALLPGAEGVAALRKRLARARTRAQVPDTGPSTTPTPDVPVAKVVTDEQRREAGRLYKQAIDAVSQRRSDDAIRYLELVWTIDPDYQRVADHLKREYLTRGMEFFADGELDKAVDLWERVLRVDPSDERARGYLTRAREQATRTREILGGSR
jgi:tetratricopeptide (TPR) repeat protein